MPSTVAIVGSGIAGATMAHLLVERGHHVTMFEAGPAYPYPHSEQYENEILRLYRDPAHAVAADLRALELTGNATWASLEHEPIMAVGGMATRWSAWTPRYMPHDFRTHSQLGYGADWPLHYEALEPYYCRAEAHLGVSGSDDDNPFAPPRSRPLPLPAFPLSYDDAVLAERLANHGIRIHTVPQARTRVAYDGRPACANMRVCGVCPIGARYSPSHHLQRALATGRLTLHTNAAVRAILSGRRGAVSAVVYHPDNQARTIEHPADVVIVAAGAINSARLLLLSARTGGEAFNPGGHVGRHLMFDRIHAWFYRLTDRALITGRAGPRSAQSYQFMTPTKALGGRGYKLDFSSSPVPSDGRDSLGRGGDSRWVSGPAPIGTAWRDGADVLAARAYTTHTRVCAISGGTVADDGKYVALSTKTDRFGAPIAHVHHDTCAFDTDTQSHAETIMRRLGEALASPEMGQLGTGTGHHHLGTCRMGKSAADSVVDQFGAVHGFSNLFVAGASVFPGASAVNPTLTLVALAMRSADVIAERHG